MAQEHDSELELSEGLLSISVRGEGSGEDPGSPKLVRWVSVNVGWICAIRLGCCA